MEVSTRTTLDDGAGRSDTDRRRLTKSAGAFALGALWRRRAFIVGTTVLAAIGAVALSLSLPLWYAAEARVLMPESGGGGGSISAMVSQIAPGAAALLGGGGGGDFTRYLAILNSRNTLEEAIDAFDLVEVYELTEHPYPRLAALQTLQENTNFEVDLEYQYLSIRVLDQDPRRSAALANHFVQALNERNAALSMEQAQRYRRYVEQRYSQAIADLDSAQTSLQRFQERHGVIELPEMARALMESAALQRAELTRSEVQYRAALAQFGPDNARVRQLEEVVRAARRAEESMMSGEGSLLPVAFDDLPAVANEYATLYRDVMMQGSILEVTRPLLEQARFDEERERTAVQVLDEAVVPEKKAKPRRAFIVITATLSAALIACALALLAAWVGVRRLSLERWLRSALNSG